MKAYVINMEKSVDRRNYVTNLLDSISYVDYEVINAVNGKELSQSEINEYFDRNFFINKYIKEPSAGQIGCCLSHFKCYKNIINNGDNAAIIFEDDITLKRDFKNDLEKLKPIYCSEKPVIILLSGWYWFNKEFNLNGIKVRKVYDGFLAQSYIINKAAAQKILELKPGFVADDWSFYKSLGIEIYGVSPRIFDQRWSEDSKSTINYENMILKGHYLRKVFIYGKELCRKLGRLCGRFESCDYLDNLKKR